eukprot:gene26567-biopygen16886
MSAAPAPIANPPLLRQVRTEDRVRCRSGIESAPRGGYL